MYIDNIATQSSMHVNAVRIAASTFRVFIVLGDDPWCRGMVAGSASGATVGVHAYADGPRFGEHTTGRGLSGRTENVGTGNKAGTSNSRGRGAGRHAERGSSSEAD